MYVVCIAKLPCVRGCNRIRIDGKPFVCNGYNYFMNDIKTVRMCAYVVIICKKNNTVCCLLLFHKEEW